VDEELWACRNVAEYAYCPRLFYYMAVEGIFVPSADTEKGCAVHRRIDRPSAAPADDEEPAEDEDVDSPKSVRSLALTSPRLGLAAVLDLTELNGTVAVPVEYRKGAPRHLSVTPPPDEVEEDDGTPPLSVVAPWPADRIQIGLQALLLEEAGYTVNKAVLYYAAEKRALSVPVDQQLREEALAVLNAAKRCAQGPRPLPLVNDPRCPRCSLLSLCLPDEINLGRAATEGAEATPRKLWPPRDESVQLVVIQQGARVSISGQALEVISKKGTVERQVPLAGLESLALVGPVQISTQALHALADQCVPVAFLSAAGRLVTVLDPLDSVSAIVRREQVRKFDKPEVCLELTRALISAKIQNQRTVLMRNHPNLPETVASELAALADKAAAAESLESARGHEGAAATIYFGLFGSLFKGREGSHFDANGRARRPPPDPVNCCLSMAYSMLCNECIAALRLARLEPSIGAFHVSRPGRPALALDLMEPFRPLVADSVAITAFNRGELTESHFLNTAAGCSFTDAGRRAFFKAYARRMDTIVTHPTFDYRLSYRRMVYLHARMIAAWLLDEVPTLSFLTTR